MSRWISSLAAIAGALCFCSIAAADEKGVLPLKLEKGKSYTFDVSRSTTPQAAQASAGTLQYKLTVADMKERGHGVLNLDVDRTQLYKFAGVNPPENTPKDPIHLQVFIGQGGAASEIKGLDESIKTNSQIMQPLLAHLDAILGNGLHYQRLEPGKVYVLRPLFATGQFSSADEGQQAAKEGIQTKSFRWFVKYEGTGQQNNKNAAHFTVLAPQQTSAGQDVQKEIEKAGQAGGQKQGDAYYLGDDGLLWSFTYAPTQSGVNGFTITRK